MSPAGNPAYLSVVTMNCPGITRRSFLADTGMGFTGLVLGADRFTSLFESGSEHILQP